MLNPKVHLHAPLHHLSGPLIYIVVTENLLFAKQICKIQLFVKCCNTTLQLYNTCYASRQAIERQRL